jgi:hypothetical protein
MTHVYKILDGKLERKRPLCRSWHKCEDYIEGGEFLHQPSDCHLPKRDCVPRGDMIPTTILNEMQVCWWFMKWNWWQKKQLWSLLKQPAKWNSSHISAPHLNPELLNWIIKYFIVVFHSKYQTWTSKKQYMGRIQQVKKFSIFSENRRFIFVFRENLHWTLSWASLIQSVSYLFKFHFILSSHLHLGFPSVLIFQFLRLKFCMDVSSTQCVLHAPHISPHWSEYFNHICWKA